jgi:ubiquinone/menaquinone biosynthesis C-methylase UbiE
VSYPFDDIVEHYDDDRFHVDVAQRLFDGLPAGFAASSVLDVGTGTGHAAFLAVRLLRPRSVVAVDLSAAMIDAARRKAGTEDLIDWRVGDAVPAPVDDGSVDLVLCASSLHFIGLRALRDWRRVLRPGGVIAFSLPSGAGFRPSPKFAPLFASDIDLPTDAAHAAEYASRAGFTDPVVSEVKVIEDRVRLQYVVHARRS